MWIRFPTSDEILYAIFYVAAYTYFSINFFDTFYGRLYRLLSEDDASRRVKETTGCPEFGNALEKDRVVFHSYLVRDGGISAYKSKIKCDGKFNPWKFDFI